MKNYCYLFTLLVIGCECCSTECQAQVVRLSVENNNTTCKASAFYIGKTDGGSSVFVTAKHVLSEGYSQASISFRGELYPIVGEPTLDGSEDVAIFETDAPVTKSLKLTEEVEQGEALDLPGYGPELQGHTTGIDIRTAVTTTSVDVARMRKGLIIQGDSGCPAVCARGAIGVVVGYQTDDRTTAVIVSTKHIKRCLARRYVKTQCGPSGCPIYIRRRVEQPIIGFGIPVGRPRIYDEAVPVPRPPQVYVPQEQPEQYTNSPSPNPIQGPPGERGPQGPPGNSVTQEQVESIVNAWLESNRESLVGPQGPVGAPGESINLTQIEGRLATLEQRPFRIILANDGKMIDDETYAPGEAVVLDLKRFRSVSDAR